MRQVCRVHRNLVGVPGGLARWDRAYQLVLIGETSPPVGHGSTEESRMRIAAYLRVSTDRQQQAQTIEQQGSLLLAYIGRRPDWVLREEHIFRDDGYSGARLQRPGLDALRDQVGGHATRGREH